MLENINRKMDDSMFEVRAREAINAMVACLLNNEGKICKNCNDVDVCTFLAEAIFAYRHKFGRKYPSTIST